MDRDKGVSVVIPNYNGIAYIGDCLEAVEADERSVLWLRFEIIVVDNASEDGSRELVETMFPDVRLIPLDKNYGFARAVNEGIRAASEEYVILLNNDTRVFPGFAKALVRALRRDRMAFSASAKLISMGDPSKIDDAGDLYCALGWAFARGKDEPVSHFEDPDRIFASCAGAACYRKRLFDKIGYFDEAHFAYLEDIDVCWRARIKGYHNLYEPRAKVLHAGSGASGSRYNEFKCTLSSRNSVWIAYKNMPVWQIVINLPFLIVGFGVKYIFFLKKGLGKTYADGILEGIRTCRECKKVHVRPSDLPNVLRIQAELWVNTLVRLKVG